MVQLIRVCTEINFRNMDFSARLIGAVIFDLNLKSFEAENWRFLIEWKYILFIKCYLLTDSLQDKT